MDLADNTISDPSVVQKLDTLERGLFATAHETRAKLTSWLNESEAPLKAAHMVVNYKKRKRVEMEELI